MANDLFAPPTKEELKGIQVPATKDMFAPPTQEELGIKDEKSFDPSAALSGFGNGVAMGYLPQLQAAAGALMPDPSNGTDEKLRAQGFKLQQPEDTYLSRRDDASAKISQQAQDSPGSYYGGMLTGAVAATPAVSAGLGAAGLGAAADAPVIAKIAKAGASGAVMGAAQNPGDTPGQLDVVQGQNRIANAKTGAVIGAASQAAASAVGSVVNRIKGIPDFINDYAETRAAKSFGANKTDFKRSLAFDDPGEAGGTMRELGRYAIDSKIVRPGDSIESVVDRSSDLKSAVGKHIGESYERANQMASNPEELASLSPEQQKRLAGTDFNPKKMGKEFLDGIVKKFKGDPNGQSIINSAQNLAENLSDRGESAGISSIHDFRSKLDDMIYASDQAFKRSGVQTPGSEAMGAMRGYLSGKITDRIQALDGAFKGTIGNDLVSLNKQYSNISKINSMAKNSMAAKLGNQFFSPTDKAAGISGAGLGAVEGWREGGLSGAAKGAAIGAGAGLVSKMGRTYATPLITSAANNAGKAFNSPMVQLPARAMGAGASALQGLLSSPAVSGRAAGLINSKPSQQPIPAIPSVLGAGVKPFRNPAGGNK